MKKHIQTAAIIFLFSIATLCISPVIAQNPPPPPPPHGGTTNVPGGGAPIGEGLVVLVALGAAYGWRKWKDTAQ
ncbi:MAG: hypothetical protein EOM83_03525 [Clostridia bacterium]|nr:hypothetical protein [Clostridia bacterium]